MIYGLVRDVVLDSKSVITVLEAFGSLWHGLIEAVSNVCLYVYASILHWKMDTFSFSSLYLLFLVSCSYIVSLLNELGLDTGETNLWPHIKSKSHFDKLSDDSGSIIMNKIIMNRSYFG